VREKSVREGYMLKYNIEEGQGGRLVTVSTDDLQRWALHDASDTPLKWQAIGAKSIAITSGTVLVYRKPYGLTLHREYMLHNSKALYLGARFNELVPEFDRLIRNMYDFKQYI
jgi:hypothetical protein